MSSLHIRPTKKQAIAYKALYDDVSTYVVFGGSAGGGKSWMLCEWLLVQCIKIPGSKWFIGREELKRLMSSTFVTFTKVCKFHGVPEGTWKLNGQYNYIEFYNGSRIDLLDLKFLPTDQLYERFGSLEYTGGAIEEAGEIDFRAFDVLKTRIGRHMNEDTPPKMFITCNPKKNWLYTLVYLPWKKGILPPEYVFIQSLYQDNPHTAESYEKQLSQISNTVNKQRLMFGIWEYEDDAGTLFPFESISDLWTNVIDDINGKYMTVDVARQGKDKTVIGVWQGLDLRRVIEYRKQGIDVTALRVKETAAAEDISFRRIVADEDGVGGGLVDLCRGIHGFINNSRPMERERPAHEDEEKTNFANLKTQCAYMMAEAVKEHEVKVSVRDTEGQKDPDESTEFVEALTAELGTYKIRDIDDDQKPLRLESKEEAKLILGRSPDYGDMFIMRGYFMLKRTFKASTPEQARAMKRQAIMETVDFDPFDTIAR